jgi:hypothetical protein
MCFYILSIQYTHELGKKGSNYLLDEYSSMAIYITMTGYHLAVYGARVMPPHTPEI